MPTWNDFVAHPNYDAFWKRQAVAPYLSRVTVPTLNVAGWWDQEDFYGPVKIYETLEKKDTAGRACSWWGPGTTEAGRRGEGRLPRTHHVREPDRPPLSRADRGSLLCLPLEGPRRRPTLPEVTSFETGTNEWRQYDSWPPKAVVHQEPLPAGEGRAVVHRPHRRGRSGSTRGSPIPRTPCPIARDPSSRPIPTRAPRAGPPGSSRTSASWRADPTSSASRPSR